MHGTPYKLRGGLQFKASPFSAIQSLALPETVTIRTQSQPIVVVGEQVKTGQFLTRENADTVASHASLSGEVTSVTSQTVSIKSDKLDKHYAHKKDFKDYPTCFKSMGLVGLGGAAFPVYKKLNHKAPDQNAQNQKVTNRSIDTLLINAAECDPEIYCDEALMQERAADIVAGITIAQKATGAKHCIVGIEDNKKDAIAELKKHLSSNIKLITVPAIYPSGAEKSLFRLCTGKQGPLSTHNAVCFNIATCYSMFQSVNLSQPLISRIVTVVSGENISNIELRIGTPINYLLKKLALPDTAQIICGGRMMGQKISKDHFVEKHTNSLTLQPVTTPNTLPCIRCGACADVCPEGLYPQQLFWHTQPHNSSALTELKLNQCIECACCDEVCPSHIPLAGIFNKAAKTLTLEKSEQKNAAIAKQRYEKRLARINNQTARQQKELNHKTTTLSDAANTADAKKALIAKALRRSKSKKSSDDSQDASR